MSAPENPSAFPFPEIRGFDGCGIREGSDGMTLRDWFAGQALAEAFDHARNNIEVGADMGYLPEEWAAKMAYGLADAMLAERAKAVQL